jgi:hypothetical protein
MTNKERLRVNLEVIYSINNFYGVKKELSKTMDGRFFIVSIDMKTGREIARKEIEEFPARGLYKFLVAKTEKRKEAKFV